jgi:hypothetical protein
MSSADASAILEELRLLREELATLRADLTAMKTVQPANGPRIEPYTVGEFAALIRRHNEYVSERCKAGVIRTLPGKPYRIPVGELRRWMEQAA